MIDVVILSRFLDKLWEVYISRVSYAKRYAQLIKEKKGNVVNDHIAFRTFNTDIGDAPSGIEGIARIFRLLGYQPKDEYSFPDKHLYAQHFEHNTLPDAPKIFISQLEVKELPTDTQQLINDAVKGSGDHFVSYLKKQRAFVGIDSQLIDLQKNFDTIASEQEWHFFDALINFFVWYARSWAPPSESVVREVDKVSQYGAWTLLFGNSVNHFTAYINKQNVPEWPDLQTTINALVQDGIPVKAEIEGAVGSKLRQSATKAVIEKASVGGDQGNHFIDWPYAYYELAERGLSDGKIFNGFLGPQATHLFEMTKNKK